MRSELLPFRTVHAAPAAALSACSRASRPSHDEADGQRADLAHLQLKGPYDLRHTFATWLEDAGIPAGVIDELMGHQGGRGATREGSAVGARYRHTTEHAYARVLAAIEERLTVALACVPPCAQTCPEQAMSPTDTYSVGL